MVVPNWNGRTLLKACVDSLLAQTYAALEIVVVDNGSDDGSDAFIEASYADRVVLVRHRNNRGFAGGVNAGIRVARGDLIALLNNDAVADPRWIEQLVTGLTYGPDVGMCASKILSLREPAIIDKVGHVIYPDGLSVGRAMGERDAASSTASRKPCSRTDAPPCTRGACWTTSGSLTSSSSPTATTPSSGSGRASTGGAASTCRRRWRFTCMPAPSGSSRPSGSC